MTQQWMMCRFGLVKQRKNKKRFLSSQREEENDVFVLCCVSASVNGR